MEKLPLKGQAVHRLKQITSSLMPISKSFWKEPLNTAVTKASTQQVMLTKIPEKDDIPYPLTKEEAFYFLKNILLIPDPLKLLQEDSILFLNTFIQRMTTEIPFTTIPTASQPMNDKHGPSFTECKDAIFSREG